MSGRLDGMSMGGRSADPALRGPLPPHGHEVTVTTVIVTTDPGRGTPPEAFESRRARLREARTPHAADKKTLTLSWDEPLRDAHVTLVYTDLPPTD